MKYVRPVYEITSSNEWKMNSERLKSKLANLCDEYRKRAVLTQGKQRVIAVDFDGTLVEDTHDIKNPGNFLPGAKEVVQDLWKNPENILVLYTLRNHERKTPGYMSFALQVALEFLDEADLFYFVLPDIMNFWGFKPDADIFIDDRNLGCEINWNNFRKELIKKGAL